MSESEYKRLNARLKLSEARRQSIFAQLQATFDLIKRIQTDSAARLSFVAHANLVDERRAEYIALVDDINSFSLEINPENVVSYQSVNAFDDMYAIIKKTYQSLEKSTTPINAKSSKCNIKVPRIELPVFNGDLHHFPYFYETFKRVIHENPELSNSERVHYLLSHLSGKAKDVAAGLIPSEDNYPIIWKALIAKYEDKRALATSYLNRFFSLKPLSVSPSPLQFEQFVDSFASIIAGLKQLKIENLADLIFVHMGLKLIDGETAKSYEMTIRGSSEMPDFTQFLTFMQEQSKILHRTSHNPVSVMPVSKPRANRQTSLQAHVAVVPKNKSNACTLCNKQHQTIFQCYKFKLLKPTEKYKVAKEKNLCINCLSNQHGVSSCPSQGSCLKCGSKHHTWLHFESDGERMLTPHAHSSGLFPTGGNKTESKAEPSVCTISSSRPTLQRAEILATAQVIAVGRGNKEKIIRCLIDPGSQRHYISYKCQRDLGLKLSRSDIPMVQGIGGSSQQIKGNVRITFSSRFHKKPKFSVEALVIDCITNYLPTCQLNKSLANKFGQIDLADESWHTPGEIDMLIGVQLFSALLRPGKLTSPPDGPDALETVLGYIILGEAPLSAQKPDESLLVPHTFLSTSSLDIDSLIKKFWEVESVEAVSTLSQEDQQCEQFYTKTTSRDGDGRYVVGLPFSENPSSLGNSFFYANRRFLSLERKFKAQPKIKELYDQVITEHCQKGYLSKVENPSGRCYVIPHHAVLREDKDTTKLRVVLDASAETDTGVSLNDILHSGPILQTDLMDILLNLRLFSVAISSDVRQMYLQIKVREQDRPYQRILYRFHQNEPITVYEYTRVSFGLKASPYLALRTINQLACDEGAKFPLAAEIVRRDIYMDDIASSLLDTESAIAATHQLVELFKAGGFELAKWDSNDPKVIEAVPDSCRRSQIIDFDCQNPFKVLGLCWDPKSDVFQFEVGSIQQPCTKRTMLASIARLFDVLGLVAPVILFAKLLIKQLWLRNIDWDEPPPEDIVERWVKFQSELSFLGKLKFPRHVGVSKGCQLTLVGFADASEMAYGGVIYIHCFYPNNLTSVSLLCAKSKVAPIKVITLARLELCAAVLLSSLMKRVQDAYSVRFPIEDVVAFSDSTVALNWIHSSPHRWQTFVANRVAKVQENIQAKRFYHVKGSDNPSDCLSRGLTPMQLIDHSLWLNGPTWLNSPRSSWPVSPFEPKASLESPESKSLSLVTAVSRDPSILYTFTKNFSSWSKLVRSACFILKFCHLLPKGTISVSDLAFAELQILKAVQQECFAGDLQLLCDSKPCSSGIRYLYPFIDNGMLRVGGRLQRSNLPREAQHPLLLPKKDHVVDLIIDYNHRRSMHAGPENLMSLLRQKYWILAARSTVRNRIRKCNMCFRCKPYPNVPLMGNLPDIRVQEVEKPFTFTGSDYAGPISYTPIRGRGVRSRKGYICLFTCLTTRAVHIEFIGDLTTASFLSCFKRFISRRGPVKIIYSDNGTNYVGASNHLRELFEFVKTDQSLWSQELALHNIDWKFIPPSSPHFGGSWESMIKVIKTHFFRTIGQQLLCFEEMITVLSEIEAVLNSRPLTVLSSDPSELTALTPAHFLLTRPLGLFPAREASGNPLLLQRFELLDHIVQTFWKRWRVEYIVTLQSRQKWNTPSNPIKIGTIVIIMMDNLPPLSWPLGIIEQTFAGRDGVIRVAQVKTASGVLKRPVVKLCPLPSQ